MSTRSRIGIIKKDKTIESVYCHSDGYPEYNGVILNNYYASTNAVNMIVALGDFSYLNKTLQDSLCYNVWRDEGTQSRKHNNLEELKAYLGDAWEEFIYLWDEETEKWLFSPISFDSGDFELEDLNDYLIAENILEELED